MLLCNVNDGLNIVAELLIIVPVGVLRLDNLVDEVAITILDAVPVVFTPGGIIVLKTFYLTTHSLKFPVEFRGVTVSVQ